jgi:hypothetical protein
MGTEGFTGTHEIQILDQRLRDLFNQTIHHSWLNVPGRNHE